MDSLQIAANRFPMSIDESFLKTLMRDFEEEKPLELPKFGQGGLVSGMTGLLKPQGYPKIAGREWDTTWTSATTPEVEEMIKSKKFQELFEAIRNKYPSSNFPSLTPENLEDMNPILNMIYQQYQFKMQFVPIPEDTYSGFYNGAANSFFWPMLHLATTPFFKEEYQGFPTPTITPETFEQYERVNQKFAQAIFENAKRQIRNGNDVTAWFQDYHLFSAPGKLRSLIQADETLRQRIRIGQFIHTPFFNPDIISQLLEENKKQDKNNQQDLSQVISKVLRQMLGNDTITFQVPRYVEHFAHCIDKFVPGFNPIDSGNGNYIIREEGNRKNNGGTLITHTPIGVDVETIIEEASGRLDFTMPSGEKLEDKIDENRRKEVITFGGLERLDYTKGLIERIEIYKHLLQMELDSSRLIQITEISRSQTPSYQTLASMFKDRVEDVNQNHGNKVLHLDTGISRPNNYRFMKEVDVMLVTTLEDGMNLVAFEYLIAKSLVPRENRGLLVLGQCGAKDVLESYGFDEEDGIVYINPSDPELAARKIKEAIDREYKLSDRVIETAQSFEISKWADECLRSIRYQ